MIVRHDLARIVVLAEADVLRTAEIRARRGILGQQPDDALHFRDKTLMKQAVSAAGIAVAPHHEVRTALELHDAVADLGYPCVVKPPHGRGSSGVSVLDDDESLRNFLLAGPFSDQGRTTPWLVEAFQSGEQYRADGVCRGGRVVLAAAAIYVNTHLDFLGGGYMGSVMLPEQSEEAQTVLKLARSVLEDALPAYDGGFHLEVFLTPEGPVFSEVGARIGGGSIPEEVELSYGFNLVEEAILAQLGRAFPPRGDRPARAGGAGELLPRFGASHQCAREVRASRCGPLRDRFAGKALFVDDSHQCRVRSRGLSSRLGGVRARHDLKTSAAHEHNYEMGDFRCGDGSTLTTTTR